jgi:hypothetical protein
MRTPRNYLLAVAGAAVVAGGVGASVARTTTTPGVVYVVKTVVDSKGIHVPKDQFTRNGITRYPRGGLIRYEFVNKGTKPYAVHMWAETTIVMKPGGHATMLVNWQYRGTYHYWRVLHGKELKPVGTVVIF